MSNVLWTFLSSIPLSRSISGEYLWSTARYIFPNIPLDICPPQLDPNNEQDLHVLLENHARLVMNVVHELVTNIDHLEAVYERLRTLGVFHVRTQVPSRYLDIMGPIFCNAVRPILLSRDVWSPEVEESWMEVFKVLTMIMKKSYQESSAAPSEQLSLDPTQVSWLTLWFIDGPMNFVLSLNFISCNWKCHVLH